MDYKGEKPYRIEFPEFDPATMPRIPDGWRDISWHNDTQPSFQVGDPDGVWFRVWVDFAKEEDREIQMGGLRYAIDRMDEVSGDEKTLVQSDDWDSILTALAELMQG